MWRDELRSTAWYNLPAATKRGPERWGSSAVRSCSLYPRECSSLPRLNTRVHTIEVEFPRAAVGLYVYCLACATSWWYSNTPAHYADTNWPLSRLLLRQCVQTFFFPSGEKPIECLMCLLLQEYLCFQPSSYDIAVVLQLAQILAFIYSTPDTTKFVARGKKKYFLLWRAIGNPKVISLNMDLK